MELRFVVFKPQFPCHFVKKYILLIVNFVGCNVMILTEKCPRSETRNSSEITCYELLGSRFLNSNMWAI